MPRTLVVSKHAARYQRLIKQQRLPGLEASYFDSVADALPSAPDAEILFGAPDLLAELLPHCPALRWVQSSWAGVTPLLRAGRADYQLTGVREIFGLPMTEYVLGWLLALERNILLRAQADHWDDRPDGSLQDKQIGIMGTGSIGSHLARACPTFGLRARGLNTDGRTVAGFEECHAVTARLEFAEGLDYLVALLPDTPASDRLIDAALLARLKPGAILINAGRANVICEDSLLEALRSGQLRHAVLDVLPNEPLPPNNPLWRVDNLSITSHTAAPTPASAIVAIFCDNYQRYLAGSTLKHAISFQRGY